MEGGNGGGGLGETRVWGMGRGGQEMIQQRRGFRLHMRCNRGCVVPLLQMFFNKWKRMYMSPPSGVKQKSWSVDKLRQNMRQTGRVYFKNSRGKKKET